MYVWNSRKNKNTSHIINPITKRTYCKYENNGHGNSLDAHGDETNRRVCTMCAQLSKKEQKVEKKKKKHPLKHNFYSSLDWRKLRYEALKKYGTRCMCCGATPADGCMIQVDHIKPRHKYPELALSMENLQILCASCNHGKYGDDETDWRTTN